MKGDWITKVPHGMSLWEAMAYGTAGYTAGIAVHRMEHNGLKPGKGPVVVNGATGGVGSIAVAMLAKLGYHVVAASPAGQHLCDAGYSVQQLRRWTGGNGRLEQSL